VGLNFNPTNQPNQKNVTYGTQKALLKRGSVHDSEHSVLSEL